MQKITLFLFFSFILSTTVFAQLSCYNTVGYYPSWVAGGNSYINSPSKIDYSKYTHICWAFAIPGNDGKISSVDNASSLIDLVNRGHANNVKILLSIGGWLDSSPDNTPFESIANSTTATNQLATTCANLVTQYNLDGIDLDWEYPTSKAKWNSVATALGNKLHGMGKIFTAAVSENADNHGDNYDDVSMLDLVNIMCYGDNSIASNSISYWTRRGVPQTKRMLGVPFYSSDNNTAEHIQKANLAKTTAGGIMIWDIATEYGDINSIYNTLGSICKGTPVPTNLASNKPVTASSIELNTTLVASNVTDGNYSTRWSSAYTDPQWIYVDLGANYDVNRVKITWEAAYATAYQIQVSTDASSWSTVKSITANTTLVNDNTGLTTTGRYVRIYGTTRATQYGYSIYELEVYGTPTQTPYGGTAWTIPGKIEAENYDVGGEGVAYHDLSATNTKGEYRTTEGVDIQTCAEGGYNLGDVQSGEWVEYTVNVNTAAVYTLQCRVATTSAGKSFHIELDGQNISGTITVPNTGGWQTWSTVSVTTPPLTPGKKVMRIVMDVADYFNLNWVQFTPVQTLTNLATNKTVTTSSIEGAGLEGSKAVDGSATTRWASVENVDPQWIYVDLGTTYSVSRVKLNWEAAYAKAYKTQISLDATTWTDVFTTTAGDGGIDDISFTAANARYVRIYGTVRGTTYGYSLYEFEVYGTSASIAASSMMSIDTYPNPVTDNLTVNVTGLTNPTAILTISNITNGKVVHQSISAKDSDPLKLNVSSWTKGIYIINVETSQGRLQKKIIID